MNLTLILTVLSTFFWGANFVLAGYILHDIPPLWAAALRFALAAVLLIVYSWWRGEGLLQPARQHAWSYFVTGAVGIAGFNLLFFIAMQTASATDASLIMATNPLLTAILAVVLLGEKPSWIWLMSIPLTLAGVSVVISAGHFQRLAHLQINSGLLLMLGANIAWAAYNILSRKLMPKNIPTLVNTTLVVSVGAILLLVTALFSGQSMHAMGGHAVVALILMTVVGTALAYLLWNAGIAKMGASRTALFMNLVPVFAMLTATALGQIPNSVQWFGGALVIFGVALSMWKPRSLKSGFIP